MTSYRLALHSLSTGVATVGSLLDDDLLGTTNVIHADDTPLEIVWALDGWGSVEFTVPIDGPDPAVVTLGGSRELYVYDDDVSTTVPIWGGELWDADVQGFSRVRFTAYGFAFRFWEKAEVRVDKDYHNGGAGTDVYDVARELISDFQARTGGNRGITFASTADRGQSTKLVICAEETPHVGEIIADLADADRGFDWEIDAGKVWRTFHPQRGSDLSGSIVFDGATTARDLSWRMDGAIIENSIAGVGDVRECDPIHLNTQTDTASRDLYGLLDGSIHRSDLRWDSDLIDRLVTSRLRARKAVHEHPSFSAPLALGGPVFLEDYNLGDRIGLVASKGGYGDLDVAGRVLSVRRRITQAQNVYDVVELDTLEDRTD